MLAVKSLTLLLALLTFGLAPVVAQEPWPFQEGCCLNPRFPRPTKVSQSVVPKWRLLKVLNCATNNRFVGGTARIARSLGTADKLTIAYYYGKFMPEQGGKALTVAVYAADMKNGILFDVNWEDDKIFVENLPPLKRSARQWRVGEVNGGLWTYTRLWYLAQEIGARPKQELAINEINGATPESCFVLFDNQTNWTATISESK